MSIRMFTVILLITIILLGTVILSGCEGRTQAAPLSEPAQRSKADIAPDGTVITFPAGSPAVQQFSIRELKKGRVNISMVAPARIVASILPAATLNDHIAIFDAPEVTSLFSGYKQNKATFALAEKNLERVRSMFESHTATAKDLNQAETDAATARAMIAETEGKLRTAGFDPVELERTQKESVWLLSDVPEAELHEVQKGETVEIVFSAFPERTFSGRTESIGDVVDPVTRTVKVRVSLQSNGVKLIPGMFARIDFGDPVNGVLSVPMSSVVSVEGKDYLFVRTSPETFERRSVVLQQTGGTDAVVLKGVTEHESIVTTGAMLLKGLSFGY